MFFFYCLWSFLFPDLLHFFTYTALVRRQIILSTDLYYVNIWSKLGMVMHPCNLSTPEAEVEESQLLGQPDYMSLVWGQSRIISGFVVVFYCCFWFLMCMGIFPTCISRYYCILVLVVIRRGHLISWVISGVTDGFEPQCRCCKENPDLWKRGQCS